MIHDIVKEIEVSKIYDGIVRRIMTFGAFVEIANGKEGLVHISNLAHERTNKVEDVLNIGDSVQVIVTEIDKQGRINLSRKALLPKPDVLEQKSLKNSKKSENFNKEKKSFFHKKSREKKEQ